MDGTTDASRVREGSGPRALRFVALAVGTALVVGVALTGCGSSKYRYVANKADRVFFRVPSSWGVLPVDTSQAGSATLPPRWERGFDASATPSIDHMSTDAPKDVTGWATVQYVSADTADRLSPSAVRAALSGLDDDPLKIAQSDPTKVNLVSVAALSRKGGLKGSRIVYETAAADGTKFTRDQSALIDPTPYPNPKSSGSELYKLYVFEVRCESACFKTNKDLISQVVTSWQVIR
jgi:hypothetical protein